MIHKLLKCNKKSEYGFLHYNEYSSIEKELRINDVEYIEENNEIVAFLISSSNGRYIEYVTSCAKGKGNELLKSFLNDSFFCEIDVVDIELISYYKNLGFCVVKQDDYSTNMIYKNKEKRC